MMFVKDGAVTHKAFEGYQDRSTRRPVDEDTIYHWASITKTFTGIAIMQLRDRGQLLLDDHALTYEPEFERRAAMAAVTIENTVLAFCRTEDDKVFAEHAETERHLSEL